MVCTVWKEIVREIIIIILSLQLLHLSKEVRKITQIDHGPVYLITSHLPFPLPYGLRLWTMYTSEKELYKVILSIGE